LNGLARNDHVCAVTFVFLAIAIDVASDPAIANIAVVLHVEIANNDDVAVARDSRRRTVEGRNVAASAPRDSTLSRSPQTGKLSHDRTH
jgi:hypothetical protein